MTGHRLGCTALLVSALALGCGGRGGPGSGDDGLDPVGGALTGDFTADASPPGAGSVSLQPGSSSADVVTVDVVVTDSGGIFGVAFDLVFDPDRAAYLGAEEGRLLDADGADTLFLVTAGAGRLVVGATRVQDAGNSVVDVDAAGPQVLASFRFRVRAAGASRIDFDPDRPRAVRDRDGVERGVSWHGGALVGN